MRWCTVGTKNAGRCRELHGRYRKVAVIITGGPTVMLTVHRCHIHLFQLTLSDRNVSCKAHKTRSKGSMGKSRKLLQHRILMRSNMKNIIYNVSFL